MTDAVHVLTLEADVRVAAHLQRALGDRGPVYDWTRVSSRDAYEAALRGRVDIILARDGIAGLAEGEALRIAQTQRPDLPFICIADDLDEAGIVERIRHGAADCVLMRRLERLPDAVRRALSETEERRLRHPAVEAGLFLEHLLSASPSMVFRFHPQTHCLTYVSPNMGWLLGYAPEEAIGVEGFWERILHPEDRVRLFTALADATTAVVSQLEQECRYRGRDGRDRWFFTLLRIEYDDEARPIAVLGYALDIADRKAAEEQVRQSRAFSDSIIENLPALVFVKDARTLRYVRFNKAAEEMLGMTREEVLGRTEADLFPEPLARASSERDRAVLDTGMPADIAEEVVATRGREPRVLHTKKIPILDENGAPVYLVGVSIDITEQRTAHEQVRLAKLEAERASRAKSEFLSRMSHDLRTPLNAILGFAQILQMDELSEEQREGLQQILRGGVHLLELINEVLDIARIEAGQLSLSPEPVPVAEVVTRTADLVRPLGAARRITVAADADGIEALHVRADRQRLKQVLVNLVSNAVKYNKDGGHVQISCARQAGTVRIQVSDTGPGIPPQKKALLFHPFERLGAELSAIEGTGLGLAVSKGLTEAMGGRIGLESTVDVGSTFWVELPHVPAPAPLHTTSPVAAADRIPAAEGTVLYVEDNRSNIRLLERLLARRPGVTLFTASTGEGALEILRQRRPGLILLDLHLPDMPGEEILRRIWADPATRSIPVAVLSADATARQQQRLLAAGAVAYLTKPLDVGSLLRVVDERLAPGRVSR